MTFYAIILFTHVTAVLTMFAILSLEGLSLLHLRRASTFTEVGRWIELVPGLPLIAMDPCSSSSFPESSWPCGCQPSNWHGQG